MAFCYYPACYPYYPCYNPCYNLGYNPCCTPYFYGSGFSNVPLVSCPNICQNTCNPCNNICNPCNNVCNPCPCPNPTVTYITSAPVGTAIPSGAVGVPPTPIPVGSTTIPAGTVTVITGFTGTPTTNIGGITVNAGTGQFTVPIAGRYTISAFVTFDAPTGFGSVGTREVYIYKIDATTSIISLFASDSRNAVATGQTSVTVSTIADLKAGDRIFFAAAQNSGTTITTTTNNRFVISRTC